MLIGFNILKNRKHSTRSRKKTTFRFQSPKIPLNTPNSEFFNLILATKHQNAQAQVPKGWQPQTSGDLPTLLTPTSGNVLVPTSPRVSGSAGQSPRPRLKPRPSQLQLWLQLRLQLRLRLPKMPRPSQRLQSRGLCEDRMSWWIPPMWGQKDRCDPWCPPVLFVQINLRQTKTKNKNPPECWDTWSREVRADNGCCSQEVEE